MTYRVIQKNKGNYYLYEVNATWDPIKKKSVQKRKYLGKCDKDGNILNSYENTNYSMDFGKYYALSSILEETRLPDMLTKVFGSVESRVLSQYGILMATGHYRIPQMTEALDNTIVPKLTRPVDNVDQVDLANLLLEAHPRFEDLFKVLVDGTDITVFVVDYVPVPFQMRWKFITDRDYGYVYTPEFTTYIGVDNRTNSICYYKRIYERISSVPYILKVKNELESMGARNVHFIFDHKKGNRRSIEDLLANRITFTCPAYTDTDIGSELIMKSNDFLLKSGETQLLYGELCKVSETAESYEDIPYRIVTYMNIKRYQNEIRILFSRCKQFEELVSGMQWSDDLVFRLSNDLSFSDMIPLYDLSEGPGGSVKAVKRDDMIDFAEISSGKTILITNSGSDLAEILGFEVKHGWFDTEMYKLRENLPFISHIFRSYPEAESMMLIEFISFMIRAKIDDKLWKKDREDLTVQDLINGLEDINISSTKNRWHLDTINNKQREMLSILDLELPSDAAINDIMNKTSDRPLRIRSERIETNGRAYFIGR